MPFKDISMPFKDISMPKTYPCHLKTYPCHLKTYPCHLKTYPCQLRHIYSILISGMSSQRSENMDRVFRPGPSSKSFSITTHYCNFRWCFWLPITWNFYVPHLSCIFISSFFTYLFLELIRVWHCPQWWQKFHFQTSLWRRHQSTLKQVFTSFTLSTIVLFWYARLLGYSRSFVYTTRLLRILRMFNTGFERPNTLNWFICIFQLSLLMIYVLCSISSPVY